MNIGKLQLENKTILAPLAGITNLPFRLIAKEAGCALVCSEMVSATGLVRSSKKTHRMLASAAAEKPLSVQIFGSEPEIMAEAAAMVAEAGADIIDINFGCSVKKIVKTGAGVALMRELQQARAILQAVRRVIDRPFTIKIRSGWDKSGRQALELAEIAQTCGVDAIAVHPRTASQKFTGTADWSLIAAVKQAVSIPVIGNGDIFSPRDAERMLDETGCDFIMIGREAARNPWIFKQVTALLAGAAIPEIDLSLRFGTMRRYLDASIEYFGEKHACPMMRSRLGWFVKGLPFSSRFRESIKQISTKSEAHAWLKRYEAALKNQDARLLTPDSPEEEDTRDSGN
jgi:nifR3 family TIM-barrel protein